jgi:hypothetical protein
MLEGARKIYKKSALGRAEHRGQNEKTGGLFSLAGLVDAK